MTSIATLERLPASALSKLLLAEQEAATNPTIAVIDVRDDGKIVPLYSANM
jgi:Cdc25 family phosphatase